MSDTASTTPQYFITVYGSQHRVNRPKLSHTFATFAELQVRPDASVARRDFTISWLPRDGNINPVGPAEAGRNYSLVETFAWLDQTGSKIRWESPETEIQSRLFQSAEERFRELEGGTLRYKMIDSFQSRPHEVSNCIHGVTDLPVALEALGMAFTGILHGIQASRFVYQYLWPFYLTRPNISEEQERRFVAVQSSQLLSQQASPPTHLDLDDDPG